jgi:hypothetical protein
VRVSLKLLWAAITALSLWVAPLAHAHTRSESHSLWEIDGTNVNLVLTLGDAEILLLARDGAKAPDHVVSAYLAERIYPIAEGKQCALVPPVERLPARPGYHKYDFTFKCESARDIQIRSAAFFEFAPTHINFAQIQIAGTGEFAEQLITEDRQSVVVTGEAEQLRQAGFLEFLEMGVMHIFTGFDHMAFLVGLVLISRGLRDLVFVVTGFTIGHSVTLALAVTGVVRPHAEFIDALVGLTILLIGAECLAASIHKEKIVAGAVAGALALMVVLRSFGIGDLPLLLIVGAGLFASNYLLVSGQVKDAGRLRLLITLVFGLIHGFGFAANLLEMQLPTDRLAALLVGFNLGVEVGQLALVLGVTGLAVLATRLRIAPPRAIVVETVSMALVAMGGFWFVERSFG